ncbi:MAG: glycosyltransferase [Armatimonadota bacterium]
MPERSVVLYINEVSWVGGAEGAMLDLVTNLDRERFLPAAVCPSDGEFPRMLRERGVPTHIVPFYGLRARNPFRYLETIGRLCTLVRRYRARLIHVNQQYFAGYGVAAARLCRVPAVVHLRGVESDECLAELAPWILRASRIICVSKAVKARLLDFAARRLAPGRAAQLEQRALVVYDGLRLVARVLDKKEARNRLGIASDGQVVGIVGQVVPEKGLREFVDAAAILLRKKSNLHFVVIGADTRPDRDFPAELAGYARQLGVCESFTFTGFREDAAEVLPALDVSVLASWLDAFPRVVLESLAAGVPTIATRVGGVPEIIEDGVSGLLVEPRSAESLAEGILRVLEMAPTEYARMADSARTRAARFSISGHLERIVSIYDELLATKTNAGTSRPTSHHTDPE